jgi:uncharacterized protein (TIGR02452 family)
MSLKGIAEQTLRILEAGYFLTPAGDRIELQPALQRAIGGTELITPDEAQSYLDQAVSKSTGLPSVEVTDETTQTAAHRLVVKEFTSGLALLSFASARNPGGGFLNGAKAQEEDLTRCSGLYPCLTSQPDYYAANRGHESVLYTDHIIYSPNVPWFRTHSRDAPNTFFLASVITAPAPNAGVALQRDPSCGNEIDVALRRRAGLVLAVAAQHGHRNLLLGAWGCGVFRNDPERVADAFGEWLSSERFAGAFDRVVFAVYDRSPRRATLEAFVKRFRGGDKNSAINGV